MDCYLEKHLKEEHANMKNPNLGNIVVMCPVFERQICLWCCLHTQDVSNPLKREYATGRFPNYAIKAAELSLRDLDSVWESCSRCNNSH